MSNEELFQANIEVFALLNPKAAVQLSYLDTDHVQLCQTQLQEDNLHVTPQQAEGFFIYAAEGANAEQKEWADSLPLDTVDVLIVFGVGLGLAYLQLKKWLEENPERHLVFLETDLAVIYRLLETELGAELLADPQVFLHFFDYENEKDPFYNWLCWRFFAKKVYFTALPSYKKQYPELTERLDFGISFDLAHKSSIIEEYLQFGVGFYKNFYPNLLSLPGSYRGSALFGKFPQIPAIICGAGPSLAKNAALLRSLDKRALIFAGGSSINALGAAGVTPHFGAGIDPNVSQEYRLLDNSAFELPFFYRSRMYHKAVKQIRGPRLYINGSEGYETARWAEQQLGIGEEGVLEEGHNVINFLMGIAHALGCNPIILVGMDLAYTDKQIYAPGVIGDSTELTQANRYEEGELVTRRGIDGQPIQTEWKWIAESRWITSFSYNHPELSIINATEGGLGMENIPNQTLKIVAEKFLENEYDLAGWVHTEVQQAEMPEITESHIASLLLELFESLKRSETNLKHLIDDLKQVEQQNEQGLPIPSSLHSGLAALYETELTEESAYTAFLETLNVVIQHVLNSEFQEITHDKQQLSEQEKNARLIALGLKKYQYLLNAVQSNILLMDKAAKGEMP